MGLGDKISNAAQDAMGKAKEKIGDATGNETLEAEGRIDQGKASAKDAIEKARDDVREGVEDVKEGIAAKFNDLADDHENRDRR